MRVSSEGGIVQLVSRYRLPAAAASQLSSLLAFVIDDPLAPTAVRTADRVLADHFADSLVALELPAVRAAALIADIGSGAGFPGLALAIALPNSSITLVDGNRKKSAFIERAIRSCELSNATSVHARVEEWEEGECAFDLVTARAVAPLGVVAEYAAPLLRLGGSLVAWRGRREPEEETVARRAAEELGLEALDPVRVHPYPAVRHRHLHVMLKVRETPDGFPRRPGLARKRPLGAR